MVLEEHIHPRCRHLHIRLFRAVRVHVHDGGALFVHDVHDLHHHMNGLLRNVSNAKSANHIVEWASTSDFQCFVGKFLYLVFSQNSEYNHTIQALFEAFLRFFKSLWIDKAAVNLCPTGACRDSFFGCL